MPTPASRAIARIDGSVPSAETNTRVATSRSWSRLRVASARSTRVSDSPKTDHAPIVLACLLQTEHSPFPLLHSPPKETSEHARTGRQHVGDHEPSGPARVIRRPRGPEPPRGTRAAGRLRADPRPGHRGWTEPDGLVHDLRRRHRHP